MLFFIIIIDCCFSGGGGAVAPGVEPILQLIKCRTRKSGYLYMQRGNRWAKRVPCTGEGEGGGGGIRDKAFLWLTGCLSVGLSLSARDRNGNHHSPRYYCMRVERLLIRFMTRPHLHNKRAGRQWWWSMTNLLPQRDESLIKALQQGQRTRTRGRNTWACELLSSTLIDIGS